MPSSVPRPPFLTTRPPVSRRPDLAPELREAVWSRCGGLCELCAERLPSAGWHAHHRKLRSRGGQDDVANVVALHTLCHTRVHGHVDWATQAGFLVASHDEPTAALLGLHGETWVRLALDGTYVPNPPGR